MSSVESGASLQEILNSVVRVRGESATSVPAVPPVPAKRARLLPGRGARDRYAFAALTTLPPFAYRLYDLVPLQFSVFFDFSSLHSLLLPRFKLLILEYCKVDVASKLLENITSKFLENIAKVDVASKFLDNISIPLNSAINKVPPFTYIYSYLID